MKKWITMLLACVMALSCTACGKKDKDKSAHSFEDPYSGGYDERSEGIYEDALGAFYDAYEAAQNAKTLSERYALMAVAEAKLMASAVMLPLTAKGGNYAISRMAPYTAPYALWGNDADRFHNILVTTKPISAAHREEMKVKWGQLRGTGEYETWAKQYLTEKGYILKNSYAMGYSADPQTWDILATSRATDAEAIVNTYDSLYEYDCEGELQPALAKSYTVTRKDDGTVAYTFTLRSGVKWVDSQGRAVADVKADDFVAGMQHMMDAAGGLEYLVSGVIVNADAYLSGAVSDFSKVGVKAVDDTTLVYTLTEDIPYFMTMLGYNVFAPMSRSFYTAQGGKFGSDFDPGAGSYSYGKSPDSIAYCGPYLVRNATAENTIVFGANPAYWNAENVNIGTITWMYNDGKDALKAYTDTMSGTIDGAGLNASSVEKAKSDGVFKKYAYITAADATTGFAFCNLNRQAMNNFNDSTMAVSPKTEEQRVRSLAAMYNVHFRRAIAFAVDRGAYNAQSVGEELKLTSLRNSFTPGNFVELEEQTTIQMGGESVTYPAGTFYGKIMQDQLDADGVSVKVWDAEAEAGLGSSDGFDGWYDPENAGAELEIAVSELSEQGVIISADAPVYLDVPYFSGSNANTNRAYAYKQSVERVLGGRVRVNLLPCADIYDVYYAGFYISSGQEANYDVYDYAGWGPDYGDPQTYLSAILPHYQGDLTKMLGIF